MVITITSLRLRRWWYFFWLSYLGLKISLQIKRERGFIKMKNTGFGYLHYTLSAWKEDQDPKRFAHTGAHREAMQKSNRLAEEIRIHTYSADAMPTWQEAKKLLLEHGRVYRYDRKPPVQQPAQQ